MAEFRDRLEEALAMNNMKASELAKITGISEGAISQYKRGAYKATQRNLEKMAKALSVSIPWLMGIVDDPTPDTTQSTDAPVVDYGKFKDVLAAEGIHVLFDADSNMTEAQINEIVSFIRFKRGEEKH